MKPTIKLETATDYSAILPPLPVKQTSENWRRFHYADIADLVADITRTSGPSPAWQKVPGAYEIWTDHDGNRGVTMPEAQRLATQGWADGVAKVRAAWAGLQAAMPRAPRLARYDVAGAVPNVARALSGHPLCMRRLATAAATRFPVVTLVCDAITSWTTDPAAPTANAIAQAAVADMLEDRGYRCEVYAVARSYSDGIGWEIAICAKLADQPINLASLVFCLGHPAVLRRLMFARVAQCDTIAGQRAGMGYPTRARAAPELGAYVLPTADPGNTEAQGRFQAMLRTLREQNCPGIPDPE